MGTPWSVTPAVHYSAYFQGIMLAKLPSYNTEPFKRDIYSKIAAVFLTMALLFRCLLAYRLKTKANVRLFVLLLSFSSYLHFI